MRLVRRLALAAALLSSVVGGLVVTGPAFADHENHICWDGSYTCSHWGNRYSPPVYANGASQAMTDWVQDAGYLWQDNGFVQGWNPGAFPGYSPGGCDNTAAAPSWIDGGIRICLVAAGHIKLQLAGYRYPTVTYLTSFGRCDTACNHIYSAVVYINGQQDSAALQRSFRHGIGEALGLGVTATYGSVMNPTPWSPYVQQHDRDVMWLKYGSHTYG